MHLFTSKILILDVNHLMFFPRVHVNILLMKFANFKIKITIFIALHIGILLISAQEKISLWPKGQMPNSKGLNLKTEEKDGRIVRIKEPELFAFLPPKEERKTHGSYRYSGWWLL